MSREIINELILGGLVGFNPVQLIQFISLNQEVFQLSQEPIVLQVMS